MTLDDHHLNDLPHTMNDLPHNMDKPNPYGVAVMTHNIGMAHMDNPEHYNLPSHSKKKKKKKKRRVS